MLHSGQKRLHTYIFVFALNFPKNYISATRTSFSRKSISRKLHITYSFVIQRNYMEKLFGNQFLENIISVTCNNVFGIHFAIISGWGVVSFSSNQVMQSRKNSTNFLLTTGRWLKRHPRVGIPYGAEFYTPPPPQNLRGRILYTPPPHP